MKKAVVFVLFVLVSASVVLGAQLDVSQIEKNNLIVKELENNATFVLSVTSKEAKKDSFQIYSLVSASIYPNRFFVISPGETTQVSLTIVPHKETIKNYDGLHVFEYEIKGKDTGIFKDNFALRIYSVKDIVDVSAKSISINDSDAVLTIKNKENFRFENLQINVDSKFFGFSQNLVLEPKEEKEFTVPITDSEKLRAGDYDLSILYEFNGINSRKMSNVKYLEQGDISVSEESKGFIVRKTTIKKANEGNIPTIASITVRRNILTRLFTVYSAKPDLSMRNGLFVDYSWDKEINVGEEFVLTTTTNYTIPLVLLILVVGVAFATRFFVTKKLSLRKRVSFVKTRGGEFALKVSLKARARGELKNIVITDRIPHVAKLYEKYGMKPHKVDHNSRTLGWEIPRLNAGEERVFTYIIYSKINIVGKLDLPLASVKYEHDGKHEHIYSNRTSFAAETS